MHAIDREAAFERELAAALAPPLGAARRIAERALTPATRGSTAPAARWRVVLAGRLAGAVGLVAAAALGLWLSRRPLPAASPSGALLANRGSILVVRAPGGGARLVGAGVPDAPRVGAWMFILHGGSR